ncbi:hypothetical protein FFF34_007705 [Inquilinus sp. KBS0705]|nr:hypothetical protein FFF34_007705 [Inquilinus sp. KBS0705]
MQYPIIQLFENDKNIYAQSKGPEQASVSLFHIFVNSIILDSQGYKRKVKEIRKVGWANFWGYHPLIKGRTAKIEYEFSEQEHLSLDNFKSLVTERLLAGVNKGFWYAKKDIPFLVNKVSESYDYKSVVECFIKDLYK